MTIEEAIKRIKSTKDYLRECRDEDLKNEKFPELKPLIKDTYKENAQSLDIAISALLSQQEREKPHPLTLEELRKMDGEKVYVPESEYYFDGYGVVDVAKEMVVDDGGIDDGFWPFCDYSENWLAYCSKPKEDEK